VGSRNFIDAEKSLTRFGEAEWSRKLQDARAFDRINEKWLSMKRTGIKQWNALDIEIRKLKTSIELPQTLAEGSHKLRDAKRVLFRIVKESYKTRDQKRLERIQVLEKSDNPDSRRVLKRLKTLRKWRKTTDFKNLAALRNGQRRQ
jgi:hypothetical protein